jgi:hypothetical protein
MSFTLTTQSEITITRYETLNEAAVRVNLNVVTTDPAKAEGDQGYKLGQTVQSQNFEEADYAALVILAGKTKADHLFGLQGWTIPMT